MPDERRGLTRPTNTAEGNDSNNAFFHPAVTFRSPFTSSHLFLVQRMAEGKTIDTAYRQTAVFLDPEPAIQSSQALPHIPFSSILELSIDYIQRRGKCRYS